MQHNQCIGMASLILLPYISIKKTAEDFSPADQGCIATAFPTRDRLRTLNPVRI